MTQENQTHVKDTAKNVMARNNPLAQGRQLALWIGALIIGAVLGWMNVPFLNQLFNFIATVFTRLFQFIAVPTIALAVITTLSMMGSKEETKKIFKHTITYTLLTTICAAGIGLLLYLWIQPGNLPTEAIGAGVTNVPQNIGKMSYYDHMLSVIPNNILTPFLTGNVLSILLIATAVGLAFAFYAGNGKHENPSAWHQWGPGSSLCPHPCPTEGSSHRHPRLCGPAVFPA